MSQSDFCQSFGRTPFTRLCLCLPLVPAETARPPSMLELPWYARHALGPRWELHTLALTAVYCCLLSRKGHRLPRLIFSRLNRFTLSHCGSHTPLTTLKPVLTDADPSLGTGCLLNFSRAGLSPAYISNTELAHFLFCQALIY